MKQTIFYKKNRILGAIVFAFFFLLIILPKGDYCAGVTITAFLSLSASLILMYDKDLFLPFKKSKGVYIACTVLSILYIVMLSITNIYANCFSKILKNDFTSILITLLFAIFGAYSAFVVIYKCYQIFTNGKNISKNDKDLFFYIGTKKVNRYIVPIIILTLLFACASMWGYNIPDAQELAHSVQNNFYTQWHTLSYYLFFQLCLSIAGYGGYLFSIIIVQSVIWILICNYILNVLYKNFGSKNICKFYAIITSVAITPYFYLGAAVKDVLFSMMMLAFSAAIFDFIKTKNVTSKNFVSIGITGIFAALFRHFAVVVVVISITITFIAKYKDRRPIKKDIIKIISVLIIPIIAFCSITYGVGNILNAQKNPKYVAYSMPIYLMVAVSDSVGEDNIDSFTKDTMESIMPVSKWTEYYSESIYCSDTVSRSWRHIGNVVNQFDDEFLKKVLKSNTILLKEHPKEYLTCFFNINSIVWEITTPSDCTPVMLDDEFIKHTTQNSAYSTIMPIIIALQSNKVTSSILFRSGLWIIAALFCSYVLIKKKNGKLIISILPAFLYALSLMISVPEQDTRYILPLIEICIFYITITYFEKGKTDHTE